jgi:GR25 family glycosyltransferase involved in LPS biosynthesis
MELLKHTLYINLDHRTDRLTHMQNQLALLDISGERFNAVKTKFGAVGCMISHIKCLEIAIERKLPQICIMEDDIQFLDIPVFKNSLQKFVDSGTEWDVLFISGNNAPPFDKVADEWVRVYNCQCGTGYIVNQHYYEKLLANMREGVGNLIRDPTNKPMYALDIYWKRLQRPDRWYLITPLTVVQAACYSDIEERNVDYKKLMLDLEKPWLCRR